jgi:hypothetical protein
MQPSVLTAENPRVRVLKHLRTQAASLAKTRSLGVAREGNSFTEDDENDPDRPKPLEPGHMQIYSYYGRILQSK